MFQKVLFPETITFGENVLLLSKYVIIYSVLFICLLILVLLLAIKLNISKTNHLQVFNLLKNVVAFSLLLLFFLNFFKFLISVVRIRVYNQFLVDLIYSFEFKLGYTLSSYNTALCDSIVLLAIITGMVCIFLLGDKHLYGNLINIIYFLFFILVTIAMVYTVNLLVLFISFEMIFIPTIYFVYKLGYIKKTDKTIKYLLHWTLGGAFLIFVVICYLFSVYKTLNIYTLSSYTFSSTEQAVIYISLFIGFGIKIPVYPFHFWLTKVHVEAPAGFSIFLSGFLVKTAVYCFFFFSNIFFNVYVSKFVLVIALLGIFDSSIKMWSQLDFKKLIAFATIQEMNIILLFLVLTNNINDYIFVVFIFIHGLLSTLMFYVVDLIQKRTSTRNLIELSGFGISNPKMRQILWGILIFFMGFPLTVKFLVEWKVLFLLYTQSLFLTLAIFIVLNVVAVIGFTKQLLILIYGNIGLTFLETSDISKKDFSLIFFLAYILFLLNFFAIYIL